jgi:hypothetical protein
VRSRPPTISAIRTAFQTITAFDSSDSADLVHHLLPVAGPELALVREEKAIRG